MEGKAAEWAYGEMAQNAQRSLPSPDIFPLDGEIHVFPTPGTFFWYLVTRVFFTATEYPTKYCILEILSNILYHIEYSSDHARGSAGCPTSQNMAYLSEPQMSNSQILSNILYSRIFLWLYWSSCRLSGLLYSLLDTLHITLVLISHDSFSWPVCCMAYVCAMARLGLVTITWWMLWDMACWLWSSPEIWLLNIDAAYVPDLAFNLLSLMIAHKQGVGFMTEEENFSDVTEVARQVGLLQLPHRRYSTVVFVS